MVPSYFVGWGSIAQPITNLEGRLSLLARDGWTRSAVEAELG